MRVGSPEKTRTKKPKRHSPLGDGASALAMVTGLSNNYRWFYPPYQQLPGRDRSVAVALCRGLRSLG